MTSRDQRRGSGVRRLISDDRIPLLAVFVALLAMKAAAWSGWSGWSDAPVRSLFDTLSSRELNKEGREALTAGYYEGLINEGSRVSSMNRLVTGNRRLTFEDRSQPDRRETNDFRVYELIPNSDMPDYLDARQRYRLRTNSAGLADREYPRQKTEGVRRVALLGDSISRGQGAPFLGNYESLLEDRLNGAFVTDAVQGFEILNFSVGSYNATQMLDTAIEIATPYEPDVYLIALSKLSVYRRWSQHIALLVYAGIDLKYDYLRTVVREAGVSPRDPVGVIDAKLARFRLSTIRWILTELQAHARARNAEVLAFFIPTVERPAVLEEDFLGVPRILEELDIPYVSLLDAFGGVDRRAFSVSDSDLHPNAAGHRLLYEQLYERIQQDPRVLSVLSGEPAPR